MIMKLRKIETISSLVSFLGMFVAFLAIMEELSAAKRFWDIAAVSGIVVAMLTVIVALGRRVRSNFEDALKESQANKGDGEKGSE